MSDDTQPVHPLAHDENFADKIIHAVEAFYFKTPVTSVYGVATLALALSNIATPTGGLASMLIGSWNMSLNAFIALMTLFAFIGIFLIFWTPFTGKPVPRQVVYPFVVYIVLVIVATFASAYSGLTTWGTFGKTAAINLAHVWLLIRELKWPD